MAEAKLKDEPKRFGRLQHLRERLAEDEVVVAAAGLTIAAAVAGLAKAIVDRVGQAVVAVFVAIAAVGLAAARGLGFEIGIEKVTADAWHGKLQKQGRILSRRPVDWFASSTPNGFDEGLRSFNERSEALTKSIDYHTRFWGFCQ